MHKLLLLILIILLGLALNGCNTVSLGIGQLRGSGKVTNERRDVGSFTAIEASGVGDVIITKGDTDALIVETDDNLQASVLSEVRGNTLYLGMESNTSMNNVTHMVFNVTVRDLKQITLSGAVRVSAHNLSGDMLTVLHSGAGSITCDGAVNEQDVTLSGAGRYDGAALASDQATVNLSGLGSVVVQVRNRLDATVSGAGSIEYIGSPDLYEQVTGMGSIQQRAP